MTQRAQAIGLARALPAGQSQQPPFPLATSDHEIRVVDPDQIRPWLEDVNAQDEEDA